jgi:hypothetical protein
MHAAALADLGHEVWLADLHDIYFVERNRASIERFPLADIVALIDAALASTDANLTLVSSSRGAQLTLIAAREWQLRHPGEARIAGVILTHAHLYRGRPEIGNAAAYLPITRATNLPVYLIDAQYSTKSAQVSALARELGRGGSCRAVFLCVTIVSSAKPIGLRKTPMRPPWTGQPKYWVC